MNPQLPNRLVLRCYSKKRPIRAVFSSAEKAMPLHSHDYYEIEIIVSGSATHYLNGSKYEIGPGTAYILNPASFHTYEIHEPLKLFCINFDGSVIPEHLFFKMTTVGAGKHIRFDEKRFEDLKKLAEILVKESKRKSSGCITELCDCVLAMLLEQVDDGAFSKKKVDIGMQKALLYINSHFYENPTLAEVAKEANYHPNYFSEMFNSYFGQTYISKLNDLKTDYAKVLLTAGFSVSEACFRSGFRSLSSFLSVFKDKTGMSPKKFKDLNCEAESN